MTVYRFHTGFSCTYQVSLQCLKAPPTSVLSRQTHSNTWTTCLYVLFKALTKKLKTIWQCVSPLWRLAHSAQLIIIIVLSGLLKQSFVKLKWSNLSVSFGDFNPINTNSLCLCCLLKWLAVHTACIYCFYSVARWVAAFLWLDILVVFYFLKSHSKEKPIDHRKYLSGCFRLQLMKFQCIHQSIHCFSHNLYNYNHFLPKVMFLKTCHLNVSGREAGPRGEA